MKLKSIIRKIVIILLFTDVNQRSKVEYIWSKYELQFNVFKENHGKRHTLKIYKACYTWLKQYTLDINPEPVETTRIDKNGIPKPLWPLRGLLKGDRHSKRIALTIARMYELIRLPLDYSTETITSPHVKHEDYDKYHLEFKKWILFFTRTNPQFVGDLSVHRFAQHVFTGNGSGPNGPAVLTSVLDKIALQKDANLEKAMIGLNTSLQRDWVNDLYTNQDTSIDVGDKLLYTGRLGFSAENGGKTRIFAIGDYWSQLTLLPIQKTLNDLLKLYETDSTDNQDRGFARAMELSKGKKTFCFDLSSASDRIPAEMQVTRMKLLLKDGADHWYNLMTQREFYIKALGTSVRWEVGQPLGLLSSFPSFALWHHDIIQLSAHLCKEEEDRKTFNLFNEYQILGDDVVIWNEAVSLKYQELLTVFGVPINMSKSILGDEDNSQIEFAKRLSLKGIEMSSLNYNIIDKDSMAYVVDILKLLFDRDFISSVRCDYNFTTVMSKFNSDFINFCIWSKPSKALDTDHGDFVHRNPVFSVTRKELDFEIKNFRVNNILKKIAQFEKFKLIPGLGLKEAFKRSSIPHKSEALDNTLCKNQYCLHPIYWAINQTGGDLGRMIDLDQKASLANFDDLHPVEYLPFIPTKDYFRTRRDGTVFISNILLSIWTRYTLDQKRNESNC